MNSLPSEAFEDEVVDHLLLLDAQGAESAPPGAAKSESKAPRKKKLPNEGQTGLFD